MQTNRTLDVPSLMNHLEQIDRDFFSNQRGFSRDFGLTIFPFFTFFDTLLDHIEFDCKKLYDKAFFVRKLWYRPKSSILKELVNYFYQMIECQWVGVQHDSVEQFIEHYDRLLERFNILEVLLPASASFLYQTLMGNLEKALEPFFLTRSSNWRNGALHTMGSVLGAKALLSVPKREYLLNSLIQITGYRYLQDLEFFLEEERLHFHQNLHQNLHTTYQSVYLNMQKAWQEFYRAVKMLLSSISSV